MSQSSTREKILEAGKRVIYKKGFYRARVSDITSCAGVAHGTFYLYFKTKEDFLLSLLKSVREEMLGLVEEGLNLIRAGKKREGAELVFVKSFELMVSEKELAKIFFFEAICSSDRFKKFYQESKALFLDRSTYALSLMNVKEPELKAHVLMGTARHLVEEVILRKVEVRALWQKVLKELGVFC